MDPPGIHRDRRRRTRNFLVGMASVLLLKVDGWLEAGERLKVAGMVPSDIVDDTFSYK